MRETVTALLICVIHVMQVRAQTPNNAEDLIQKDQFAQAETVLRKTLVNDSANVEALYRLAYVCYRQRKLPEARQYFNRVVELAPPALYSHYFLGRIALLENEPKQAIAWLEPVVGSHEPVMDASSQLAKAYQATGEKRRAVEALRTAIAEAPWDSALHYRLGRLYQELGQPELARESLATSSRMKAADRESVELLQKCADLVSKSDRPGAVQCRDTLLARDGVTPDASVAVGVILGRAGWQEDALVSFQRAASRDPGLFQAQFNTGLALLKLGRQTEAEEPLLKAVALLPQSVDANAALGLVYVLSGRFSDAAPVLRRAAEVDSQNQKVSSLLALAYLRTGAPGDAITILRPLVASRPKDAQPYLLLVEALNAKEDQEGALKVAEEARAYFSDNPKAQLAAAQQMARMGRYQDAAPLFARAAELAPGDPNALLGWADALQKGGEHQRAIEIYRRALGASNDFLPAKLGLARSMMALRQLEEARLTLEEALPAHEEDTQLRFELSRVYARLGKPDLAAEQTRILEQLKQRRTP